MRYSPEQRETTKQRILDTATRVYRQHGFNGLGLGALMKSIGLTHGGFYLHFHSKSDLLLQLISRRLSEVAQRIRDIAHQKKPLEGYRDVISDYLCSEHSQNMAEGCLLAALCNDMARLGEAEKAMIQTNLDDWLKSYTHLCEGDKDKALLIVSAMLGALQLSRLQSNKDKADEMLTSVKTSLLEKV